MLSLQRPISNTYLDIVLEKYLLRKMIQTCTGVVGRVFDYEGQVDALLDEVERDILRISEERVTGASLTIKELVNKAISKIEEYHQTHGMLTGISTGFADFDKMTTGLHEGEMIVIAARPSVGKTSLAMNIAEHVSLELKVPVGVFSLEMTADQLVLRMLCSRSRVNLRNIRDGFLAERDFPKLTGAAGKLAGAPLFIDDSSALSILQLRAKARRMWQQFGIKLFVIDYLQLLNSTSRRAENRQQEMAELSGGIKSLAKELSVPNVAQVDPGAGAKHAQDQLVSGHFQAEHAHRHLQLQADVFGDVHGQGSLAHGRARGNDDHFPFMQTGGHFIEIGKAGGNAGEHATGFGDTLRSLKWLC